MILVLDNYDSFTYNLVQCLGELGAEPVVRRNDEVTLDQVSALDPAAVVISPGPGTPSMAGISKELIKWCAGHRPLLGVCLGHQALAEAFGGTIGRAGRLMHGKTSSVVHSGEGVFAGLPSPFIAMRYKSLLVDRASLPGRLRVTAWSEHGSDGEVMGIADAEGPLFGVQFHPESVGTVNGKVLLENFLRIVTGGASR